MRITQYSDYALRTLIYLAVVPDKHTLVNIQDVADSYGISKNHLTKIVHQLSRLGLIDSLRGKNGGIRLALSPKEINIGAVLRHTEVDFGLVECFLPLENHELADEENLEQKFQLNTKTIPINQQDWITKAEDLPTYSSCVISPVCQLKPIFFEAIQAFLAVFDRYTLADLVSNQEELFKLLK